MFGVKFGIYTIMAKMELLIKGAVLCCYITCIGCLNLNYTHTLGATAELACEVRELVTCGNSMGYYSWEFCRPRTRGTRNILSVHLDLRYPNRYCRSYGTPKNFGLTEAGDSMWVIKSCFGTFLLCLDIEPPSPTPDDLYTSTSSTPQWSQKDVTSNGPLLVNTRTSKRSEVDTRQMTEYPNHLTKTLHNVTKKQHHVTETIHEKQVATHGRNITTEPEGQIEIIVNENEKLDFTTKVLIIAAIATAGLCLICLIVTVGWFTVLRRGRSESGNKSPNDIDPEETTVTSLPVFDTNDLEGIYNVIPFDEDNAVFENDYVKPVTVVNKNYERNEDRHIYASFQRKPSRNGNTSSVPNIDENEYDRLRNTPRVSVSHCSTYSHIGDVVRDDELNVESPCSESIPNGSNS